MGRGPFPHRPRRSATAWAPCARPRGCRRQVHGLRRGRSLHFASERVVRCGVGLGGRPRRGLAGRGRRRCCCGGRGQGPGRRRLLVPAPGVAHGVGLGRSETPLGGALKTPRVSKASAQMPAFPRRGADFGETLWDRCGPHRASPGGRWRGPVGPSAALSVLRRWLRGVAPVRPRPSCLPGDAVPQGQPRLLRGRGAEHGAWRPGGG